MLDQTFLDCQHAGRLIDPQLRFCHSPKLIGLKQVTPDLCAACVYRDHADDTPTELSTTTERLADCLYLGDVSAETDFRTGQGNGLERGEAIPCSHSAHDFTTRVKCRECADYQFPVLSPRMSVADIKRIRLQPPRDQPDGWWSWPNVQAAQRELATEFIAAVPEFPSDFSGKGIVVVGGGKYFASAYVTIRVLRHVGTELPIQLWHLAGEVSPRQRELVEAWGVECVDADAVRSRHPFRFLDGNWWKGWQLKPYAIMQSPFEEVLLLDADCYPVRNPEVVFRWPEYERRGAIFWPDIESSMVLLSADDVRKFGVAEFEDRPTESGELLINKQRCWKELNLALHYNAQADFTYNILWGDKDTFPIAWKRLGTPYARMHPESRGTPHGIQHFDQYGDLLFQHRCTAKFSLDDTKFDSTPGQLDRPVRCEFQLEGFCHSVLNQLRTELQED